MPSRKPNRKPASRPASPRRTSAAGPFLLGLLVAAAVAACAWWYLHRKPLPSPVHIADVRPAPAAPERTPASRPPAVAIPAPTPPFGTSEDVYEAGARLYVQPIVVKRVAAPAFPKQSCASCHGSPAQAGAKNPQTVPPAKDFFTPAVQPSSPSEVFVRTKYGVPGSPSMPAYRDTLTDRQIWQIALLLANAHQPLPDPVSSLLETRPRAVSR